METSLRPLEVDLASMVNRFFLTRSDDDEYIDIEQHDQGTGYLFVLVRLY